MNKDLFRLQFTQPQMSADGAEAEVLLYGQIIQYRAELFKDSPEDKSAIEFDKAIKAVREQGAKKLLLRINSPGGIVTEAIAMRSILCSAGFEAISIRIEGLCASAATMIASIPGAHVSIAPGSEYMIHNPWTFGWGNANELERIVQHLRSEEATARAMYMARCGQDEETIKGWMDAETWFTAAEAVENGFCDAVAAESENPAQRIAACVSSREMGVMRALYTRVPESVAVQDAPPSIISTADAAVAAAQATEHKEDTSENEEEQEKMTIEELRAQEPALYDSIMQEGAANERQRIQDIDELTPAGYESMAAQAKQDGMSAMDYHKAVIRAQRERGQQHLEARKQETAPAKAIAGGAAEDEAGKNAEAEMDSFGREMASYAQSIRSGMDGGMY